MNKKRKKAPATFLPRSVAYIIDSMILGIPGLISLYWILNVSSLSDIISRFITILVFISIPMVMIKVGYYVYSISKHATTPGKAIVGLELLGEKDKMLSPWWTVFREYIAKSVSAFLFGLGFVWIIRDKDNLSWHDMLAGTKVYQKEDNTLRGIILIILLFFIYFSIYFLISQNLLNNSTLINEVTAIYNSFLN